MEPTRVSTPQSGHTGPTTAHTARSNKGQAQAGAQSVPGEGGAAGWFLSLLSALGSDLDSPLLAAEGTSPVAPEAGGWMAWLGANGPDATPDLLGQGNVPSAVTQGTSTLALAGAGTGGVGGAGAAWGTEAAPAGGLVAQTALLDTALETHASEGGNPLGGARRNFSRMQSVLSQGAAATTANALAAGHRSAAGDPSRGLVALAAAPAHLPERRDAPLGAGMPRALSEVSTVALAPMAPLATAASVPETPALARTHEGGRALDAVAPAWDGAGYGAEGVPPAEAGSPMAEPGQAGAEDALAEQVAYWVSENLQNAELTVTHDGKPVEVSVSVSGNEANIVFGSDQSETRDLLDASVAQLRDLLDREGLVLSGVTVGGSGARHASEGEEGSRGRQGGRQAPVLVPTAPSGTGRPGVVTDRAVDVFV